MAVKNVTESEDLMPTYYSYTVAPSQVENMMAVKNGTELEGLRQAYLRDGVSFVRCSYYCHQRP